MIRNLRRLLALLATASVLLAMTATPAFADNVNILDKNRVLSHNKGDVDVGDISITITVPLP